MSMMSVCMFSERLITVQESGYKAPVPGFSMRPAPKHRKEALDLIEFVWAGPLSREQDQYPCIRHDP